MYNKLKHAWMLYFFMGFALRQRGRLFHFSLFFLFSTPSCGSPLVTFASAARAGSPHFQDLMQQPSLEVCAMTQICIDIAVPIRVQIMIGTTILQAPRLELMIINKIPLLVVAAAVVVGVDISVSIRFQNSFCGNILKNVDMVSCIENVPLLVVAAIRMQGVHFSMVIRVQHSFCRVVRKPTSHNKFQAPEFSSMIFPIVGIFQGVNGLKTQVRIR